MPRKKNERQNVKGTDMVKKLAKYSDLTIDQVNLVMNGFADLVQGIVLAKSCPEDISIAFPKLGKFVLRKKSGLKAGSTYKRPIEFGSKEMVTIEVKEDMGDFLRVFFEVSPSLQKDLKEKSRERGV